ncbi:MAG TPA: hypothetical protein VKS78_18030 [Roseiarcus sp.]|nr:hypothetical protein [Roseiarcus sp.]
MSRRIDGSRSSLLVVAFAFALTSPAKAGDGLCATMLPGMATKGALYAAKSDCPDASCVQPVTTSPDGYARLGGSLLFQGSPLEANARYNFLFRTIDTPVSNSVVVVQMKLIAANGPREDKHGVADVVLMRGRTDFACRSEFASPYPTTADAVARRVTFTSYDHYHRSVGHYFDDDENFLDERFHIGYSADSAKTCSSRTTVWTNSWGRRELFLLNDRAHFQPSLLALARKVGRGLISSALAADGTPPVDQETKELPKFSQFIVRMASYQKKPGDSGCFSFPVDTHTDGQAPDALKEIDLGLRDLEELQLPIHDADRYRPTIWKISVATP